MTERVTRSRTGATPRKPDNPGFVETPGPRGRSRKSIAPDSFEPPKSTAKGARSRSAKGRDELSSNGTANGHNMPNGHVNGDLKPKTPSTVKSRTKKSVTKNYKYAPDQPIDFGGSWGTSAMMLGFPLLMWYMWIGATYYDGGVPRPAPGESVVEFVKRMGHLVYEGAFPHLQAWVIYWTFLVVQVVFYLYMPGIYAKGKPLEHLDGKQLDYYCSALWSWWTSIILAGVLHVTGLFPLYTLLDEFGPLMSVAIISGFLVSIVAYASALLRGAQHRMSGYPIYDFFMGAELNPRMFGWLDFKMFFEVRLPWFILFFISLAAAARQYDRYGYVSGEVGFLVMAHWLYGNACSKAEELIVTTWDMYFEKWGFMLIFWNLAGVPLSYCHCTIYLANHDPAEYAWPKWALVSLYASYLFVYWVWDSCNAQKNMFRASERGKVIDRRTFPQMPWKEIKNPRVIKTKTGDSILADGWYGLARKVHYSCDLYFAITWGLITGFKSPFPWFYPVFFAAMITHRAYRDIQRCRAKYGDAWTEYEKLVPYLFIPYVI